MPKQQTGKREPKMRRQSDMVSGKKHKPYQTASA